MTVVFWLVAALAAITAVGVVTLRNPVHIALTLVLNTACLALLYLSMSAEFLAVAQLLLYAGGIMVLFLFILTLLGPDLEESRGTFLGERGVAIVLGLATLLIIGAAVVQTTLPKAAPKIPASVEAVGTTLFTGYLFPLEVVSALLLAATVGAVMLSRHERQGENR
ncbi:MAG TPA: NADH-quinone oxidoreductase subunit J [Thermomicrobiales bacterium]|jgi:NADH-quinone oxidoreductase subunit J